MFCFNSNPEKPRPRRSRLGKLDNDNGRFGRFTPHFHGNRQERAAGNNDTTRRNEAEAPPSRRSSIRSRNGRLITRSSHDELKDVENQLYQWLNTREVPFDASRTTVAHMLSSVFASHHSLWQSIQGLEDKLRRRNAKIQDYEANLLAAEQEISRLQHNYENLLTRERMDKDRLVAAHGEEVAALNMRQRESDDQHKRFVDDLESNHRSFLSQQHQSHVEYVDQQDHRHKNELDTLIQDHQDKLVHLDHLHKAAVDEERKKVTQAEADMRVSIDDFKALQDDQFAGRFYKLTTEIESLSRLAPAADFIERAKIMGIHIRVPPNIPSRDHKLLLQSVLWAIVVDGIFCTPFRVFGAYGDVIYETWTTLFNSEHTYSLEWPAADPLAERWRYTAVERLEHALNLSDNSQGTGQTQQIRTSYHSNHSVLTSGLMSLFAAGIIDTSSLSTRLQTLLDQASRFAIRIALERCRVRVFLPLSTKLGPNTSRKSGDIKDVYPGKEKEIPFATAEFVVAPGLSREGNSRGGRLEDRVSLTKALVFFDVKDPRPTAQQTN